MIAYNEVATDYRSDKKDKESKIKAYVSDPTVTINEKNVRQYTLKNFSSSLFFSNYQVPIIIEDEDRRFNVVENYSKLRYHPYYKKFKNHDEFLKSLNSELHTFAQFLINYKCDSTKANTEFTNDAKKKIIGSSMGIFEEFAKKLIAKDYEWLRDESGVFLSKNWNLETVKDGYILKDVAVDVFNKLYAKNFTSPNILSKQLQHYGIKIDGRVMVNNSRVSAYTW
jgi:vesicle coat complex subunit